MMCWFYLKSEMKREDDVDSGWLWFNTPLDTLLLYTPKKAGRVKRNRNFVDECSLTFGSKTKTKTVPVHSYPCCQPDVVEV